jgi:acyl carrier protein
MEGIINFVSRVLKVPVDSIDMKTAYGSIPQWTSIMHLRLVMEIEEEYGVEIPMDEIPSIKTIADFQKYIERGNFS